MIRHNRKSIRLKHYDYSQAGLYFLTLVTKNRQHLFGQIIGGEMYLNLYGQIAAEEWRRTVAVRKNISLGAFVVMPDHLHGIISIDYQVTPQNNAPASFRSPTQTIGAMVRGYKGATTKRIKNIAINYSKHGMNIPPNITIDPKKSIWQRDYYDVIIRNEQMHKNITNYIRHNPEKWEENRPI